MSQDTTIIVGLGAFLVTVVAVLLAERFARRRGMLDTPVWRSSHSVPTPRLGGIGIIAGAWVAFLLSGDTTPGHLNLMITATALGFLGLVDDVRPLSPLLKLLAQGAAACVVVIASGVTIMIELPALDIVLSRELGYALAVVWLVGMVNVWNFMDGIDGIAAGTAAIAAIGLLALGAPAAVMLALAGSSVGFLVWNHHPASIFMGDTGSMFIGLLIGGAVLTGTSPVSVVAAAVLLAPFLLDSAYTLAMRIRNRRPILAAHHEHLYQRLSATGVPQRHIAAGYWLAAVATVGLATVYERGGGWAEVSVLAVLMVSFGAYVAFVRDRERKFVER